LPNSSSLYPDLQVAQTYAYQPNGLSIDQFVKEEESQDYGAATFRLNHQKCVFRIAKITPTKIGQFVTFWKRIEGGPIQPFDLADSFDLLIISVRSLNRLGQFVFPKVLLYEKGIISHEGKGGKRAMRIYPPWDIADNKQAKQTQKWQLPYFFEIRFNEQMENSYFIRSLFH
jgi:hypothetical protein